MTWRTATFPDGTKVEWRDGPCQCAYCRDPEGYMDSVVSVVPDPEPPGERRRNAFQRLVSYAEWRRLYQGKAA